MLEREDGRVKLRVPKDETARVTARLLAERNVADLTVEDPPIEDVIEPYLLQQGFIQRTPRGRMACARAYAHLGLTEPPKAPQAGDLFGGK